MKRVLLSSYLCGTTLAQLLKRPEIGIDDMVEIVRRQTNTALTRPQWKSLETEIKYEGYLVQQLRQIQRLKHLERRRIPEDFAYGGIPGLSREVIEKMERVRPTTLGQASRISGVTPAAISIINVYLDLPSGHGVHA